MVLESILQRFPVKPVFETNFQKCSSKIVSEDGLLQRLISGSDWSGTLNSIVEFKSSKTLFEDHLQNSNLLKVDVQRQPSKMNSLLPSGVAHPWRHIRHNTTEDSRSSKVFCWRQRTFEWFHTTSPSGISMVEESLRASIKSLCKTYFELAEETSAYGRFQYWPGNERQNGQITLGAWTHCQS